MKQGLRFLALAIAMVLLVGTVAACGSKVETTETPAPSDTPAVEEMMYYDMLDTVQDSSDLPDWTGEQLTLTAWYAHGTGDAQRNLSENDVVTPEITRVTGVTIDPDTSFDNGGNTIDVKLGMLNAGNDWPDIALVSESGLTNLQDLIEAGKVYDLTPYLEEYAPHLMQRMPFDLFPEVEKMASIYGEDGQLYGFPLQLGNPDRSIPMLNPDFNNPTAQVGADGGPIIYIRDDILKMLYPEAKTEDEIEAMYEQSGKFSEEEIYDVPVKTTEDVIQLFYDIKNLIDENNLTENGKPIQVSYAYAGNNSNWWLDAGLFNAVYRIPTQNNYYTVYDKEAQSMEYMWQSDVFKEGMQQFNQFVRDGVMDPNSLIENETTHNENLNNGQYVITYLTPPDETILKEAGKTFRYRPLYIDSPVQTDKYIMPLSPVKCGQVAIIFKDSVSEEDLPQIIRYLDYMVSEVGEKMYTWGPRSAGLFEEASDGTRTFTDKDLEACMVYKTDNGKFTYYNLTNTWIQVTGNGYGNAWPYYPTYMWGGSDVAPYYSYTRERTAADGKAMFDPGNLPGMSYNELGVTVMKDHQIWSYFGTESVDHFWESQGAFEKALTKTLAAKDEAQFEQLWKEFQDLAVSYGATPEMLAEIDTAFKEANAAYMDEINN